MTCDRARECLSAALDDEEIDVAHRDALDDHLDGCAACRDWRRRAARITDLARALGDESDVPTGDRADGTGRADETGRADRELPAIGLPPTPPPASHVPAIAAASRLPSWIPHTVLVEPAAVAACGCGPGCGCALNPATTCGCGATCACRTR